RRKAAAGDGGGFQEGGRDVLVAVFADDLFGKIGFADLDILAPARGDDLHGIAVRRKRDLEAQAAQDVEHGFGRDFNAQNRVDAADARGEALALPRGPGADVDVAGRD